MGLSKWSGVHPYLRDRVQLILDVADRYGIKYTVTSGVRSAAKQYELFLSDFAGNVAPPGCSLHQYRLAVDVFFDDPRAQRWYQESARNLGLYPTSNSPTHVQAISPTDWFAFRKGTSWCPDPSFPHPLLTSRLWRTFWSPEGLRFGQDI